MAKEGSAEKVVRAVDAVAVELPGSDVREVAVPDLVCVLGQQNAVKLLPPLGVEKRQLNLLRVLGEECEVHSAPVPRLPARIGLPWPKAKLAGHYSLLNKTTASGGSVITMD